MTSTPRPPVILPRRDLLRGAGALGAGAAMSLAGAPRALAAPSAQVLGSTCTLTPSSIEGPFWFDSMLVRRDITEGLPGVPMVFYVRVLDDDGCTPVPGAVVDVWHCEALGAYSGYASQGTAGMTWLRGIQLADMRGIAWFQTVFPGWYPGRTTHVHVKVNPTAKTELTTQVYFADELSERIHALPPYDAHGQNPTRNRDDAFFLPQTVAGHLTWTDVAGARRLRLFSGLTIVID